ncbi:MAG: fatty acid desaturase [Candidatus Poseidoniales archaeon]|nr:fatty acid desaturase [Candidatus Poseidoniales archaeon]
MSEYVAPFRINWLNSIFLLATPLLAIAGIIAHWSFFGNPGWTELIVFTSLYFACGLSITVGYHRLFSHRSHDASWPLVLFYSIFGAGAFQNSIIEWCSDHRMHHKMTDSDEDPYSASRGFWYSHIGWILIEEEKFANDFSNVKDLQESKIIMWQHRNIFLIGAASGFILPAAIGYLVGGIATAIGCFVWGGLARIVFVHHGTFLINSAAHIWGKQPYSEENSSKDSFWLAFLTFGEGYHNFHHTFQADYRNGHKWYHVDPSKWWIGSFRLLGLKSNLKSTPKHSIEVAKLDMKFKKTAEKLEAKKLDTQIYESRLTKYRDSLRSCLYDLHKARKELKIAVKDSKILVKEKIAEMKTNYAAIKADLKKMFKEMDLQYKSMIKSI